MGMFDRVFLDCECGSEVEFQSKSGVCDLEEYKIEGAIGIAIAQDLYGQIEQCKTCGRSYKIQDNPQTYVYLDYEEVK